MVIVTVHSPKSVEFPSSTSTVCGVISISKAALSSKKLWVAQESLNVEYFSFLHFEATGVRYPTILALGEKNWNVGGRAMSLWNHFIQQQYYCVFAEKIIIKRVVKPWVCIHSSWPVLLKELKTLLLFICKSYLQRFIDATRFFLSAIRSLQNLINYPDFA